MAGNVLIRKLFHTWFLLRRPMTLGVRILVENSDREILMVRHTYVPGWHFPGGGVERGEHAIEAAEKELREETGMTDPGELELLGVYWNNKASNRDHVVFFRCIAELDVTRFQPNRGIAEIGFFGMDKIPEGTTPATLRRLGEVYQGDAMSPYW